MIKINSLKYIFVILFVGLLAWFQTLNFWFFKAYEATWLQGMDPNNFVNLIRTHSFLYFIDWKLFGWNPWGWYSTSLVLHLTASILLFFFVRLISKSNVLSFVSALFFVANTAYNDVLTWGSFNSYYPLLLIVMLSSLITFVKYKETGKRLYLIFSLIFASLGFFTRETGIVVVPLLTILDIIFSKKIKTKEAIRAIFTRQVSFYLVLIGFFIIRSFYGGTPGDTADSNVKLQMRFVQDGLYLEYAKSSFLTFGKLIPPQIIPYPFLNLAREFVSRFVYFEFMNTYFFSILGWVIFGGFGAIVFKLRKSIYFRASILFLIWLGVFSLFVSLAIPNTPEVLSREYEYNTMRYRYFAFAGTSVLLAIILAHFLLYKRKIFTLVVASIVVGNVLLLWEIEQKVYAVSYKPAKEFYKNFTTYFPTLPKESVFYLYPHASGLSDYLLEWYLIKEESYPNLIGQPFRVESQIIAVLDKVNKGKIDLSNVFFLDLNAQKILVNKTEEARNLLTNQKEYYVSSGKNFNGPFVEIPQNINFNIRLNNKESFVGKSPDSPRFRALVDYSVSRNIYINTVSLETAYTMSQREGEPFFHVLPKNLVDGNTGFRSSWIADTFTPFIIVDLKQEKDIVAVSWRSIEGSTRIPATYSISVSKDKSNWQQALEVKNFNGSGSIDIFSNPVRGRFVRMDIKTTSGGDFVQIDEFEVIDSQSGGVLSFYKDREELLKDTYDLFKYAQGEEDLNYARNRGLTSYWAKLSWETNTTSSTQNGQFMYFPYSIDKENQNIIFEMPEGEVYAGSGQFFKKRITSVSIDFGVNPFIIEINSLKLVPRINIK